MTEKTEVVTTALVPLVKGEALDLFKNEDAAVMLIEKVKDVAVHRRIGGLETYRGMSSQENFN